MLVSYQPPLKALIIQSFDVATGNNIKDKLSNKKQEKIR